MPNRAVIELINDCRSEKRYSLREFAEPLGVSYNAVALWEAGKMEPKNESVLAWTRSETPWIKQLGLEIFAARYGPFVEALLRSAGAYAAKRVPA